MNRPAWLVIGLCASASLALTAAVGPPAKTQTTAETQIPAEARAPTPAEREKAIARRRFEEPPKVVSLVKSLRVEKMEVESSGSEDYLLLTLRNNSERTVACVSFCTTLHRLGYSSWTECGRMFTPAGDFYPLYDAVEPYGERRDRIPALMFTPGRPLYVCAATFTDGTQEGDERVREGQKKMYEEVKEERRKPKGLN